MRPVFFLLWVLGCSNPPPEPAPEPEETAPVVVPESSVEGADVQPKYDPLSLTESRPTLPEVKATARPGAPNVLLISLDTVRPDRTSVYGHSRDTTPLLAGVAAKGAVFEHAYAQAPSTSPTHASMFTGLYPSSHGYYSYKYKLAESQNTLAEIFRASGYRTFAVASSVKFVERTGLHQGFEYFARLGGPKNDRSVQVNDKAIAQMQSDDSRPFFGFLHYFDAHAPYAAPEPYLHMWHPPLRVPKPERTSRFIQRHRRNRRMVTPEIAEYLAGLYDGELTYLDQYIGALMAAVPQSDARSTLVILTSDHGEAFFEHKYLGHSHVLYEEIMRVPLIVWWPGHVPAGKRLDLPTQTVDLMPTVLDLVGLKVPKGLEGRSVAGVLTGKKRRLKSSDIFLQSPKFFGLIRDLPTGRHKLTVRLSDQQPRLYNLTKDPGGFDDLTKSHPSEFKKMKKVLSEMPFEDPRGRSVLRDGHEATELQELKALGYIE